MVREGVDIANAGLGFGLTGIAKSVELYLLRGVFTEHLGGGYVGLSVCR